MNWTKIYNSIPHRMRDSVGAIVIAVAFVAGPTLLTKLLYYWS